MNKKGKIWIRRIAAFALALLMAVSVIPGNILVSLAADPLNVTVVFSFQNELGSKLTAQDELTVVVRNSAAVDVVKQENITKGQFQSGFEVSFTGEAGDYSYEISSPRYGVSITDGFQVDIPAEGTDSRADVTLDTGFDNIEGQFTTVNISGVVKNGDTPVQGVTVKGYYDSSAGVSAFQTTSGVDGAYSGTVNINSTVILVIESIDGYYVAPEKTVNVVAVPLTGQDIAVAVNTYRATVTGADGNIIDSVTVNGETVTDQGSEINYNDPCVIVLHEKENVGGRYTVSAAVGDDSYSAEYNPDEKTQTITIPAKNTDIGVSLSFDTALNITNLESSTDENEWDNQNARISGTVTGADAGFTVSLERRTTNNEASEIPGPISDQTDFSFEFSCEEGASLAETYDVVLTDTITKLTKTFSLATGEGIYIDKVAPVIGDPERVRVEENVNWYDAGGKWWAKNGAQYIVEASDANSGVDEGSFSLTNTQDMATIESNEDGTTATVTIGAKDEQTIAEVADSITVKDKAENCSEVKKVTYGIDTQAPSIKAGALDGIEGIAKNDSIYYWDGDKEFKVTFSADDNNGSGVASCSYRIVNEKNQEVQSSGDNENITWDGSNGSITIPDDNTEYTDGGQYFVYVTATDYLGNTSGAMVVAQFTVDISAPKVTYDFEMDQDLLDRVKELFGIYHKDNLKVTVTAEDAGVGFLSEDDCFGELKYNEETIIPENVQINEDKKTATAEYTLVLNNSKAARSPIQLLSVRDALANEAKEIPATAGDNGNSNLDVFDDEFNIKILLENEAPQVQLSNISPLRPDYEFKITETEKTLKKWYAKDKEVTYTFSVSDVSSAGQEASGLYEVVCEVNGTRIDNDNISIEPTEGKLGKEKYSSSEDVRATEATVTVKLTEENCNASTGECSLNIYVIDNAYNTSSSYTDTIYFDCDAPEINSFKFSPADVDGKTDAELTTAVKTDYGYFFNVDTKVTVNVTDHIKNGAANTGFEGSGVGNVEYKLIPVDDLEVKVPTEWTPAAAPTDHSDNYTFTVPEGFKGNICVRAADHVSQTYPAGEEYGGNGVSPEKVILESVDRHQNVATASITLGDTPYRDADGNRLYNGTINAQIVAQNTFAGLRNVIYTRNDGTNGTQQQRTFTADIEQGGGILNGLQVQAEENNIVTRAGATDAIGYGADAEVSNITVGMSMTCNAAHTDTVAQQTVSYDTWAPRLEITWDNNDVRNGKYYNSNRTATIVVTERNFDESACEFITTGPAPSISGWSHNGDIHTATVTFSADGDYTFTFRTTDRAGHTTAYDRTDEFVIDQTNPVIAVSYDNNSAQNGYYYQDARTATVTITEHNFSAADVVTSMTANDNGTGIQTPSVNGWMSGSDVNTATIRYNYDGEFTFGINYTDLAGNPAEPYGEDHFVVDLTDPELEIYDIADKSANNGEVAPGVRYSDTNVDGDGVTIELTGANNGEYSLDGSRTVTANGVDLKLNDFPYEKEADDLYTMTAHVEDLSGRLAEQTVMFSVNRFGSVYVLDDATKKLVDENDGYTNEEQKIGIREINVDLLEESDVSISRDGEMKKLKADDDYTVKRSGDENTWKEYYYQLDKENFEEEGAYNVTIFSKDRAENTQDNKNNKRNEACNVEFVIDKTAPSTVVTGIADEGRYRETEKEVHIDAKDNIRLEKIVVEIDGKITEFDSSEISGSSGTVDLIINSANKWQNVKIYSVDKAGNTDKEEQEGNSMRVIITSNLWVQFVNNTPLLIGVIALLAVIAGGCIWFFVVAKRKKDEEKSVQ